MITVVFNIGMEALEFPPKQRVEFAERMVQQLEMILLGAEAMSKGWKASSGERLARAAVAEFEPMAEDTEYAATPM